MKTNDHKQTVQSHVLISGSGQGKALVLAEPLSLWGGLDPATGEIIDRRHPQTGQIVTDRVLVLPSGRGSSSASSILLEAVRAGTAPAAIITQERDGILALGAATAKELYGSTPPVVLLTPEQYDMIKTGDSVGVDEHGAVSILGVADL